MKFLIKKIKNLIAGIDLGSLKTYVRDADEVAMLPYSR